MTPSAIVSNSTEKKFKLFDANLSYSPLPGSRKIYKSGTMFKDLKVPFRQIALSPTIDYKNNSIPNPPVELYDTSGPYTDPDLLDMLSGYDTLEVVMENGLTTLR
jgi:hypothetical protein